MFGLKILNPMICTVWNFLGTSPVGPWMPRKYFITKEGTSICAFGVGGAFDASKGGVVIAAAHTVPWLL